MLENYRWIFPEIEAADEIMTGGQSRMARQNAGLFIDLFAGCGGLSLGLMQAGWGGCFAVERDPLAFETLRHNLIDGDVYQFEWPEGLPKEPHEIGDFTKRYDDLMESVKGRVSLVAAGPPCQGFSFLGARDKDDSRNRLFLHFLEIVDVLEPNFLLLENVPGIDVPHGLKEHRRNGGRGQPTKAYSHRIRDELFENHGYKVFADTVKAKDWGVPQTRPRYFMVGIRRKLFRGGRCPDPFELLEHVQPDFFADKDGLEPDRSVTTREAISDLEASGRDLVQCKDFPRFKRISYEGPTTAYQKLMHRGLNGETPNSLRLVNHRSTTVDRFRRVQRECRAGVYLGREELQPIGIGKHQLVILHPDKPAHTISTLPDDQLHYSEPRVLTVREEARLQSFPDWFEFQGKYTTGGSKRTEEAPRYTQVGNAVAPFVAEAFGQVIDLLDQEID